MQVGWYLLAVLSSRIFLVRWESPVGLQRLFTTELDIFARLPEGLSAAWDEAHILCNNCFVDCHGGTSTRTLAPLACAFLLFALVPALHLAGGESVFHLLDKQHEPLEHRTNDRVIKATGRSCGPRCMPPLQRTAGGRAGCSDIVLAIINSPTFHDDLVRLFAAEGDDGRSSPHCVLFAGLQFEPTTFFQRQLDLHMTRPAHQASEIGMHLRSGPKHVSAQRILGPEAGGQFFDCVRKLSESERAARYFVAADSAELRSHAQKELGSQAWMVHHKEVVHSGAHEGRQGWDALGGPIHQQDVLMAYIEWWLLGEMDTLMLTVTADGYTSTYGLTAAWRRCTPKLVPMPLYNCTVLRHPTLCVATHAKRCACEPWLTWDAKALPPSRLRRKPAGCLAAN